MDTLIWNCVIFFYATVFKKDTLNRQELINTKIQLVNTKYDQYYKIEQRNLRHSWIFINVIQLLYWSFIDITNCNSL